MPEYDALSVRLNKENLTLEQIDKRAEELGLNRSKFVMLALEMMVNFDPAFWKIIEKIGKGFDVAPWMVIQNMLMNRFAKEAAELMVWGKIKTIPNEFIRNYEDGQTTTITGEELFDILYKDYFIDEEQKKFDLLFKKATDYFSLDDKEKEFLMKFQAGKAWLESDAYKDILRKEQEVIEFFKKENIDYEKIRKGRNIPFMYEMMNGLKEGRFKKEELFLLDENLEMPKGIRIVTVEDFMKNK